MKKHLIFTALLLAASSVFAQTETNYDEAKVPAYTLPDVLKLDNGKQVKTAKEWEELRRPEVLEMFASQVFGHTPTEKIPVAYETLTENPNAFGGKATSRQVKFTFKGNDATLEAILLLVIPNKQQRKTPVFVGYNYSGNHSICNEPEIFFPPQLHKIKPANARDWVRGSGANQWKIERLLERGYAVATMCYHDIYPDVEGYRDRSAAALFSDYKSRAGKPDEWQAIGAWAWGLSRIVDYLETVPEIDAGKIALIGHSRIGKATVWAGAQDTRFKIVISNNSGEGGAALSKRIFGERVRNVSSIKPFWFCQNYNQYADNEENMPFDHHELLALVAPRKLYVASAVKDLWCDPRGEYLAAYHASPVYQLYGLHGLDSATQPALHQPILNDIGYHIRAGGHDVTEYDWLMYLDFADKHFSYSLPQVAATLCPTVMEIWLFKPLAYSGEGLGV